jgi:hypothetical protein
VKRKAEAAEKDKRREHKRAMEKKIKEEKWTQEPTPVNTCDKSMSVVILREPYSER